MESNDNNILKSNLNNNNNNYSTPDNDYEFEPDDELINNNPDSYKNLKNTMRLNKS